MAAQAITNPPYLIPSQHRIPISTAVQPAPQQPTETETALTHIIQILKRMNAEKKPDFKKQAHYFPGGSNPVQQGTSREEYEFDISTVQCWVCGDYGHFADHCPNEPLPVESQTILRKTILAEKRRSRRNSLGREVSTQNPLTILKNSQNQGTSNTNENPIRSPSPHVRFHRAASVQVTHHPNSYPTASACAILARIPAVRGLMAAAILREGVNMAANQPLGGNRTGVFKDKVIESRIAKKAKQKTISLADILTKATQENGITEPEEPSFIGSDLQGNEYTSNDPQPPVHQYPPNYPRPLQVRQHSSNYQGPSAQVMEGGEAHSTEAEGLKLLEDIMQISMDEDTQETMDSDNIQTSTPQRRVQTRKCEFERAPPILMLRGQKQYDLEEVLQSIQPELSLAELLDASATLRQQLYCLLRSIIPRTRRRSYKVTDTVGSVQEKTARPPGITSRAKEDGGDAEAMDIEAWVGNTKITDILVDGG